MAGFETCSFPLKSCSFFLLEDKNGSETPAQDRISCPYDPSHSCSSSKLSSHLEKCPSRPKAQPDYVKVGVNSAADLSENVKVSIRDVDDEKLTRFSPEKIYLCAA